jgi:hypothetical protein
MVDVANRKWWIRTGDVEQGPVDEDCFQEKLRAGEIPLKSVIKSNYMKDWEPLLMYISTDETFRRPSTMPPPEPKKTVI